MTYNEKKQIIILWIQKTTDYKKYIFDIDKYIKITQDIVFKDLELLNNNLDIDSCQELRILMNVYLGSFDTQFFDFFKERIRLVLYADFLISMHTWCINKNIRDFDFIRKNHSMRFVSWVKNSGHDHEFFTKEELKWFLVDLRYKNI